MFSRIVTLIVGSSLLLLSFLQLLDWILFYLILASTGVQSNTSLCDVKIAWVDHLVDVIVSETLSGFSQVLLLVSVLGEQSIDCSLGHQLHFILVLEREACEDLLGDVVVPLLQSPVTLRHVGDDQLHQYENSYAHQTGIHKVLYRVFSKVLVKHSVRDGEQSHCHEGSQGRCKREDSTPYTNVLCTHRHRSFLEVDEFGLVNLHLEHIVDEGEERGQREAQTEEAHIP